MKRKLGINCECISGANPVETLELIKAAGFDSFFSGTYVNKHAMPEALRKKADELGLEYEFIHAPFSGINNMWLSGMDYLGIFNGMKTAVDYAAKVGVSTVIIHVSSGWNAPAINDLGLARFDALVEHAIKKGIILAFENLRKVGNLSYFTDRYEKIDNVRYCYDCGHRYCYTPTIEWMDIFRDKLVVTHLHDNFGLPADMSDGDYHLLPFDGSFDYARMMRKFDEYNYAGALTLEVGNNKELYSKITPEEFVREAYARVKKISEM